MKFSAFVLFCCTGDAGEVEAAAGLLKSLLKGETPGLHLLEGWCVDVKYLCMTPARHHCTTILSF